MGLKGCKFVILCYDRSSVNTEHSRFLWVDLQLKYLCHFRILQDVDENLGKLPTSLKKTYEEIYRKVRLLEGRSSDVAKKALMWLICFRNPPTCDEWVDAVCTPTITGGQSIHGLTVDTLLEICYNLVNFDHQSHVIRFAHLSVREYFEGLFTTADAAVMATNCCLAFLSDSNHWLRQMELLGSPFLPVTGFHAYVLQNWIYHAKDCYRLGVGRALNLRSFLDSQAYPEWIKMSEDFVYDWPLDKPCELDGLLTHLRSEPTNPRLTLCYLGDIQEFSGNMLCAVDLNICNEVGETYLFLACLEGHFLIVEALLDQGVDVNAGRNIDTENPLIAALKQGNPKTVDRLLEKGAHPGSNGGCYTSLVHAVIEHANPETLSAVLDKYSPHITESMQEKAAANRTHGIAMTELLLGFGAQVLVTTPVIIEAASNTACGLGILKLLLTRAPEFRVTEQVLLGGRYPLRCMEYLMHKAEDAMTVVVQGPHGCKAGEFEGILNDTDGVAGGGFDIDSVLGQVIASYSSNPETLDLYLGWPNARRIFEMLLAWPGKSITLNKDVLVGALFLLEGEQVLKVVRETLDIVAIDERILCHAAARQERRVVELLLGDSAVTQGMLVAAAKNVRGKECLECLLERSNLVDLNEDVALAAIRNPDTTVFEFLLEAHREIVLTNPIVHMVVREIGGLQLLLSMAYNIEVTQTLLESAVLTKDSMAVETLLRRAPDLEITGHMLNEAVKYGCIETVAALLARAADTLITRPVLCNAACRSVPLMNLLLERLPWAKNNAESPEVGGSLALVDPVPDSSQNLTINSELATCALRNNDPAMIKFLVQRGLITITEEHLCWTASHSHSNRFRFLHSRYGGIVTTELVLAAMASGSAYQKTRYLLTRHRGMGLTEKILNVAAKRRSLEHLLTDSSAQITEELLAIAAGYVTAPTMRHLLASFPDTLTTSGFLLAAASNRAGPAVLELLLDRQKTSLITEQVLLAAVNNTNSDCIRYLLDRYDHAKLTEAVLISAIEGWNRKTLAYVVAKAGGGAITENALLAAVGRGNRQLRVVLAQEGISVTGAVLVAAFRKAKVIAIKPSQPRGGYWSYHRRDVPTLRTIKDLLSLASDNHMTEELLVSAASARYHHLIEMIFNQFSNAMVTDPVLFAAATNPNLEVLKPVVEAVLRKVDDNSIYRSEIMDLVLREEEFGIDTELVGTNYLIIRFTVRRMR